MSTRPREIRCELCGEPVPVRPSGRIPRRHPGRCPTPRRSRDASAPPAPQRDPGATVERRLSPRRWLLTDGTIVDAAGTTLGHVGRSGPLDRRAERPTPDVPTPSERQEGDR